MDAAAYVGRPKDELDTPALIVDLDLLDQNISRIAGVCRDAGKAWRPHTKGFRVPAIAHRALAAGAIGVTCATLADAEIMTASGVSDILIANQVVGRGKPRRLAELCRHGRVTVAIDDIEQARAFDDAACAAGVRIGVVIEVEIGLRRAGIEAGFPVASLAEQVALLRNVEFRGVMGWEGRACPIADPATKEAAVASAVSLLLDSAETCRARGFPVEIVSCGGTGTYPITARQNGVTELQAGGGILCDLRYRENFGVRLDPALTMLTTVTSRPSLKRIVCDGGKKKMSEHPVLPCPLGIGGVAGVALAAEHIIIELVEESLSPRIGDTLEFLASYVDTTVHLHDFMFAARNGVVEGVWLVRRPPIDIAPQHEAAVAGKVLGGSEV
jgi:D-serine deaminase-like pyridoxal phosphate-dependent protein